MAKATTPKKAGAKPKTASVAKKPAAKKTVEVANAAKKVETKVVAAAASEKKEIDKMVAAIKEQAADMKPKMTGKKGGFGGIIGAIVLIILVGLGGSMAVKQIRLNKAKAGIRDTITKLSGGMVLKDVTEFKEESGVYKFSFTFEEYADQPFTSYMSTDGKLFFVEGYPTAELDAMPTDPAAAGAEGTAVSTCESVNKNAAPELAAYIVADCPYGTQMQMVMVDAIAQAPELANNFKVRYFFDSIGDDGTVTAMHGDAEAQENLRQICIREEQAAKYWDYVSCYASGSDSATCLTQTGIAAAGVDACMKDLNRGIAWAKEDNALAQQHVVQGSPTLVLNDSHQVSESGFGGRTADGLKSIVCCSSDNAFGFCSDALTSSAAAATGDCN